MGSQGSAALFLGMGIEVHLRHCSLVWVTVWSIPMKVACLEHPNESGLLVLHPPI